MTTKLVLVVSLLIATMVLLTDVACCSDCNTKRVLSMVCMLFNAFQIVLVIVDGWGSNSADLSE